MMMVISAFSSGKKYTIKKIIQDPDDWNDKEYYYAIDSNYCSDHLMNDDWLENHFELYEKDPEVMLEKLEINGVDYDFLEKMCDKFDLYNINFLKDNDISYEVESKEFVERTFTFNGFQIKFWSNVHIYYDLHPEKICSIYGIHNDYLEAAFKIVDNDWDLFYADDFEDNILTKLETLKLCYNLLALVKFQQEEPNPEAIIEKHINEKFSVGDKVCCIDSEDVDLIDGDIYTVKEIIDNCISVDGEKDANYSPIHTFNDEAIYSIDRFIFVEHPEPDPEAILEKFGYDDELKKGEIILCIQDMFMNDLFDDEEETIHHRAFTEGKTYLVEGVVHFTKGHISYILFDDDHEENRMPHDLLAEHFSRENEEKDQKY